MKKIILVTGAKGGGGKTPVAISLALSYYKHNIPTLVCDFNFNNHDLFTIIYGANIRSRKHEGILDPIELENEYFWKISNDTPMWLGRWNSILELGLPSITTMWEKIRKFTKLNFPDKIEVMIIDTNLTFPLICPPLTKIDSFLDLPPIHLYHLHSPSITLQLDEQERFTKAMDIMNRFSPGFEQRMVHIFTPRHHSANTLGGKISSLGKGEFNIANSSKLKNKEKLPAKPVLFKDLKSVLFRNYIQQILNFKDSGSSENLQLLLQDWFNHIYEFLNERDFQTSNVIIIQTVINRIAMLVEELSIKPRRTLESIERDLGTMVKVIINHVNKYNL